MMRPQRGISPMSGFGANNMGFSPAQASRPGFAPAQASRQGFSQPQASIFSSLPAGNPGLAPAQAAQQGFSRPQSSYQGFSPAAAQQPGLAQARTAFGAAPAAETALEQRRAELNRAEQATKATASQAGAYVGVVSKITGTSVGGAIQCSDTDKQFGAGDVPLPSEHTAGLKVGDTVVFRAVLDERKQPLAQFARKLEELTEQRQQILEFEVPLPHPGNAESAQEFMGFIMSFQPDPGYGYISCAETKKIYGNEVWIHRDQMGDVNICDAVRFKVALNAKGEPVARKVRKAIPEPAAAAKLPPPGAPKAESAEPSKPPTDAGAAPAPEAQPPARERSSSRAKAKARGRSMERSVSMSGSPSPARKSGSGGDSGKAASKDAAPPPPAEDAAPPVPADPPPPQESAPPPPAAAAAAPEAAAEPRRRDGSRRRSCSRSRSRSPAGAGRSPDARPRSDSRRRAPPSSRRQPREPARDSRSASPDARQGRRRTKARRPPRDAGSSRSRSPPPRGGPRNR